MSSVIDGAVATMDGDRTEHAVGHVVVDGARIETVAEGRAPAASGRDVRRRRGCLATPAGEHPPPPLPVADPGVAVDHTLFEWLTDAVPGVGRPRRGPVRTGATGALVQLARTGCTTTMDHHYVFPADGGDLLGAEIAAARTVGLRFLPTRGSMDLGASRGGLPDQVVEEIDAILAATAEAIDRHHDPSPDSMLRVASPRARRSRSPATCSSRRRAGPRQGRPAAHPPRRDDRRGRSAGSVRLQPRRVRRVAGLARARTCGWRTASTSTTRASRPWPPRGPASPTARRPTPAWARASAAPATCGTPVSRSVWASTAPRPTRRRRWSRRCATQCCSRGPSAGLRH